MTVRQVGGNLTTWVVLALLLWQCPASALDASRVLVVYNADSCQGRDIADYYLQTHPDARSLALTGVPCSEQIGQEAYLNVIRPQILAGLEDDIDCIVTTKGLPLRIVNPGSGNWNTYSSLESELARIDTIDSAALMGNQKWYYPYPLGNPLVYNPYANRAEPFSHATYGTRLTCRLDGYCVDDVKRSIDNAQRAYLGRPNLQAVLDDYPDKYDFMTQAASAMDALALAVTHEQTRQTVTNLSVPVWAYVTHGTNGSASSDYLSDDFELALAGGAVFHSWESFNAYTFDDDTDIPYDQGCVADWIAAGGSAGVGHVWEPVIDFYNVAHEDILLDRLARGFAWAEAAWAATYQLSYVNTVIGDPLMRFDLWIEGDYDLDGDVDEDDYLGVVTAVQAGLYDPLADMDGDGVVDDVDISIVQTSYAALNGVHPQLTPEPASLAMLGIGAAALLRRKQ